MLFPLKDVLLRSAWRLVLLLLGAGALSALALPPVNFFPILVFTLPVLFLAAQKASSHKKAALWGFLFGMGLHIAGLYWLTNAILTRVHEYWWVVPLAAPGVSLLIAPLIAVPAVLCRFVPSGWSRILMFAGCWTLADMSRVFIFSGFPWNPLGSALELPGLVGDILIQPAALIGVDGLTASLVLASLALWQGRRGWLLVLSGCVLWVVVGSWHLAHLHDQKIPGPVLVMIQGNVSEKEVLGHDDAVKQFRSYLELTRKGVEKAQALDSSRPVVVVWPESAFPGLLDEDKWARRAIAGAAGGAMSLIGSDRRADHHWYNSLEAIDARGDIRAIYDKSRLVPFGEYQPSIIPFNILPEVITPGAGLKTWDFPETGRVGPMVCYEIIFSGEVTVPHNRPDWLLTISNDAWYGNSAGPYQHLATGRMRAVEEGLPVVFVNNRGVSALYDARGHEVRKTKWGAEEIVVSIMPSPRERTFFSLWGKWIPVCISVFLIIGSLFGFYKKHG